MKQKFKYNYFSPEMVQNFAKFINEKQIEIKIIDKT